MSLRGDHRRLIRAAIRAGCTIARERKHVVLRTPSGALVVTSATPSDRRASANLRAGLRRAGVEVEG